MSCINTNFIGRLDFLLDVDIGIVAISDLNYHKAWFKSIETFGEQSSLLS
jgi:hypothetical protein